MKISDYFEGFKAIYKNISALSCIFGVIFGSTGIIGILTFHESFFRQRFLLSVGQASLITTSTAISAIIGSLIGNNVVKKIGKKPTTVLSLLLLGFFLFAFINLNFSNLLISIGLRNLATFFIGLLVTSRQSLILEQIPRFRGSMMSLNMAAASIGSAMGSGLGGLTLILFNYEGLGILAGFTCLFSAIIFHFFVVDNTLV
jgi:predicted MFS family arabinose efflux permease